MHTPSTILFKCLSELCEKTGNLSVEQIPGLMIQVFMLDKEKIIKLTIYFFGKSFPLVIAQFLGYVQTGI